MVTAFCPGHITCFFQPVRTDDVITTGSRGVGIKISKGTRVTLEERSDDRLSMTMDGVEGDYKVTSYAIRYLSKRGFDVTIENDLPVGQGFGMSASGAIAAALCAGSFEGIGLQDAFVSAHCAEVKNGGGLGDVSAITCRSHVPIRTVAGLPPNGKVIDSGLSFEKLYLKVLDGPLNTGCTLGDPATSERITVYGSEAIDNFIDGPSKDGLFALARRFSSNVGLETESIKDIMRTSDRVGMCMLGHSVFSDDGDDGWIECSSTDELPFICKE